MSNFQNPNVPLSGGRIRAHILARWRCANPGSGANLTAPEVAEAVGRKLGVSDGVLDVLVAEIRLQAPGVVNDVGQRAARVGSGSNNGAESFRQAGRTHKTTPAYSRQTQHPRQERGA
jgi:hypothetical protein